MGQAIDGPEHFDAVVVGSGFGGSVMAYRLAAAGKTVCVLERGRAYPPGTFPRTPAQMGSNFWDPSEGLFGLFDIWSFPGIESVVASGLGGGSLVYANALIRKPEKWFVRERSAHEGYEYWPVTRADLDPHYSAVERMLKPTPYPSGVPPYSDTVKTRKFGLAARAIGADAQPAPLAITFGNSPSAPVPGERIREGPNLHGHRGTRYTCRLVGECDLGCNWGSKNSLDFNYLSAAYFSGAEIRTRCEVKRFWPAGKGDPHGEGGWMVRYVDRRGDDDDPARTDHWGADGEGTVHAGQLILAAGCFGTTYLLLRMRDLGELPRLSPALGSRFCANGDFLSFAARCRERRDTKPKVVPVGLDPTYGPVITSYVRFDDHLDDETIKRRGFYLQDGGFPNLAAWGIEIANTKGTVSRASRVALRMLKQRLTGAPHSTLNAEAAQFLGQAEYSNGSLPLLAMGRDFADGTLKLSRQRSLTLDWKRERSKRFTNDTVRVAALRLAMAMGADDFKVNLSWYLRRFLTVHPLGGCPMGETAEEGVVDSWGEVFGYENLCIADGSVMPGPVGTNPSLTIAALGNRFAGRLLGEEAEPEKRPRRRARRFPREGDVVTPREPAPAPEEEPGSVAFDEEMGGFVTFWASDDYEEGFERGRREGTSLAFHLEITVDDVDGFCRDRDHKASANGYVRCAKLGGVRPVRGGSFNLFALRGDPPRKRMLYRLPFESADGDPLTLLGHKEIEDDFGPDLWTDTTTLFARIVRGHPEEREPDPPTIASGILRIGVRDFIQQLGSFRSDSSDSMDPVARFGRFFLAGLADEYSPLFFGGRAAEEPASERQR